MEQQVKGLRMLNVSLMMILMVGLLNHVILIPVLLSESGRDSWLSVLGATGIILLWSPVVYLIARRTDQQMLPDWLRKRYGRTVSYLITIPLVICLFAINAVTVKDTVTWTVTSYLPFTPPLVVVIMLTGLCFWASRIGIQAIAFSAGIIAPLVILLGLFVMTANLPNKHYGMVTPILENGFEPVWRGIPFVIGGFIELFLLNLFQHHVQTKIKWMHLLLLILVFLILTLGPLMGAISEFGPTEATRQRYPAYEQWRLVRVGKQVEHLDFMSIYQWLSGSFIRISLLNFLTIELLGVRRQKLRTYWLLGVTVLLIVCALIPLSDIRFFEGLATFYFPIVVTTLGVASLVVCGLTFLPRKIEGANERERS